MPPNKFLKLYAILHISVEIREELRPQNLTFTEIAKQVGESWQVLLAEEKEPYESQASTAKEKYQAEMIKYKKTDEYKEYSKYLADFKIKNASVSGMKPHVTYCARLPTNNTVSTKNCSRWKKTET